nr:hypothetical protein [Deltaproteobacteria bacterium]
MVRKRNWWLAACALALGAGCTEDPPAVVTDDDSGIVDTDTGFPPKDTGFPVEDTGNPVEDTGNPVEDTGTPPADAGMCAAGQTECSGACVDTTTSAANCGSCGNACGAEQTCVAGTCTTPMTCPSGQTSCGGACVDTQTDATNCGACGMACGAGSACMAGACRAVTMCPSGQTACAGVCVDAQTDNSNCGACGTACTAGQACTAGVCAARMCPTGQTDCSGTCINTNTDAANCGMCGRSCTAGQTCTAGACIDGTTCPAGQTRCSGTCVDTQTDNTNCGACGMACASGLVCRAGACVMDVMACPAGQTRCGSTCVDLQTSGTNCGACARSCPSGQSCAAGVCTCATGQTLCGAACVNTQTSNTNCGACGTACPSGQSCTAGVCGITCPSGQTLCGAACVNTQTSSANCGACGTACRAGQTCAAGACACPSGQTLCGTTCVSTQTSSSNCGRCDNACASGQTCAAGACACPSGQTLCGTGASARCANFQSDRANCGRCGNACTTGQVCVGGGCRSGTAPANDQRTGATVINLAMPNQTLAADTTNAANDTTFPTCSCTSGQDVYFRFTLTAPELIYADTIGTAWDTSLFLQTSTGANITNAGTTNGRTCDDDLGFCGGGSAGRTSQILARLAPGTYYLVLSGCASGPAMIHFQHTAAGNGPSVQLNPTSTVQTLSGTTSGTGTSTSGSCTCTGGPDNSYWWVSCPSATAATFYATSCGTTTTIDNEVEQRSPGRTAGPNVCNDDTGFVCGARSTLTSTLPAGAGLHTVIADGCSAGAYQIRVGVGTCAAGRTYCGTCIDPQTDNNHCGGCNRQCATGTFCRAGACVTPPSNDTRAAATVISMTRPSAILPANTTNARNEGASSTCGCTSGNDVFYRFTLTAPEIVYADTIGTAWDTGLFFQNSAGSTITASGLTNGLACNDDGGLSGCNLPFRGASQVMARLDAGTYYLVLSGCAAGSANIRFHHLPVGNGSVTALNAGSGQVIAGSTSGTGRVTSSCCSGGPENTYYWYTCGAFAGGTFSASTCFRASWDTELDQRSAGRATVATCNDDVGGSGIFACGIRSSISTTIPSGPGLHTLYVDGCTAGTASGSYSVNVTRP